MAITDTFTITTDPPELDESFTFARLHVTPADLHRYKYEWQLLNNADEEIPDRIVPGVDYPDSARLELGGLLPGLYKIQLTVTDNEPGDEPVVTFLPFTLELSFDATATPQSDCLSEGDPVTLAVSKPPAEVVAKRAGLPKTAKKGPANDFPGYHFVWTVANDNVLSTSSPTVWTWDTTGLDPGPYNAIVTAYDEKDNFMGQRTAGPIFITPRAVRKGDILPVTLRRTASMPTDDQALWAAIRNRCEAISFERYNQFVELLFCGDGAGDLVSRTKSALLGKFGRVPPANAIDARLSINSVDAYNVLRLATEVFLLLESGVVLKKNNNTSLVPMTPDFYDGSEDAERFNDNVLFGSIEGKLGRYLGGVDGNRLPYFERILSALIGLDPDRRKEKLPYCDGILQFRFSSPSLVELIWSYWHEEGMLVQTMNAIAMRFQNRRGPAARDPLAELAIDPLRPLNNLLWGYIQNEQHRLSVPRRAYEYDSQYGISIFGKAVPKLRSADSRSKFLEAFHVLLNKASQFYREDSDTTVVADAFPLLKAIREVHLILAEGAHNQFGDLPWTARVEMMIEQWLLARPEMGDFMRGRAMVPYREDWMGRVDAMKKLQGWSDTTITHFQEMATYGDWIVVNNEDQAKNWARYWKPEIQAYIHAYRAATGVDLTLEPVDSRPPSYHLRRLEQKKLASQW